MKWSLSVVFLVVGFQGYCDPIAAEEPSTASKSSNEPPASLTRDLVKLPVGPPWKKVKDTADRVVYLGDPGDVYYVTVFHKAPDLPPLDQEAALQEYFRNLAQKENGGIIHVEATKIQGVDAVVFYTKQTVEKIRGYRYVARCLILRDAGWYEVRMDAIEMTPISGEREAVASLQMELLTSSKQTEANSDKATPRVKTEDKPPEATSKTPAAEVSPPKRIPGWFKDPYDSKYDSMAMMSVADDPKFDEVFPDHPLSRVRAKFPVVLKKLQIDRTLLPAIEEGQESSR